MPRLIRYLPDPKGIGDASLEAMLKDQSQHIAEAILEKAKQIAQAEGHPHFADSLHLETDQRPGGRGQIMVVADSADAEKTEFGDTNSERRRILGRAAGVDAGFDS